MDLHEGQTPTFEGVGLLLHRLPHHLPEAVGDGQAQVLGGHLVGLQHAVTGERRGNTWIIDTTHINTHHMAQTSQHHTKWESCGCIMQQKVNFATHI